MTSKRSTFSLIFAISLCLLVLAAFMIGIGHELVFGSSEMSRNYERTAPTSASLPSPFTIHESLRDLHNANEIIKIENDTVYRLQIDDEGRQVINVTIFDFAGLPSPKITADNCGDGSNEFITYEGDLRWMEFPVIYAVNPANSGVPPSSATNAVVAAFNHFDTRMPGQAFLQTTELNSADILVRWQFIDGQDGTLALASFSFIPSTGELVSASITYDSGDSWFVATSESCGQNGNLYDIQDIGTHELGHAVGLDHVNDDLLTMFPTAAPGETLKRSLGTGDKSGISFLYGNVQGQIGSLTNRPTNNIVNTNSFYDVVFLTGSSGIIKSIQVTLPAGTTIPAGAFFNEAEGIGPGTASKSGQTITYTVTSAVNIPAGTKIRLEFANINNPLNPSANYKVTVTTRDAANAIIDGPTQSTAYTIKQIGKNAIANNAITTPKIADNSITSTKPNQNFMKRVTLTDNAAGNNAGWNPDGSKTTFAIMETNLSTDTSSYVRVFVENPAAAFPNCVVTSIDVPVFNFACNIPPGNGAQLNYRVDNLPANVM